MIEEDLKRKLSFRERKRKMFDPGRTKRSQEKFDPKQHVVTRRIKNIKVDTK